MGTVRILSLLPAATEMVYLLGLEEYLVGVSDEVTSSPISNNMSSLQIDQAVKNIVHKGTGVFHIDEELLKKLKPNLILTQELCEVCAVGFNQVQKAARVLDSDVKIISLEPESVEDILENIVLIGEVTGTRQQARKVVNNLQKRIENLKFKIENSTKPKVCVIEWLEPVMIAGHWVPEMVEIAGGEMLITKLGEKSRQINLAKMQLDPDILIISPCGFDIQRTFKEKLKIENLKLKIETPRVFLVDGNAYMTRPGPKIVDGIEILAEILHPEIFPRKHNNKDWQHL